MALARAEQRSQLRCDSLTYIHDIVDVMEIDVVDGNLHHLNIVVATTVEMLSTRTARLNEGAVSAMALDHPYIDDLDCR